ncbi:hypothetical protein C1646_774431 [Rhizophagus diaphanus]|nr:hypothetical protein C1646_774431 [Rhizophagus diaphanus] [Rhizophagus sp. MUCL 43196]
MEMVEIKLKETKLSKRDNYEPIAANHEFSFIDIEFNPSNKTYKATRIYISQQNLPAGMIRKQAVFEMYIYCKNNSLVWVWSYMWREWYIKDRWNLWARSAFDTLSILKITMIVKSPVNPSFFDTIKCNNQYPFLIFDKAPMYESHNQTINNENNNSNICNDHETNEQKKLRNINWVQEVERNFNQIKTMVNEKRILVPNFELDAFVDVDSEEKASEWVTTFQSHSKTTMPQTKAYDINGNWIIWIELLADRSVNPDYNYTAKLFQKYREGALGNHNGKPMFERLAEIVQDYNNFGQSKAILQEYDAYAGKDYIFLSFEPLNSSITLIYTSCAIGALPFGLFITSDKLKITLEKSINLLKTILPPYAFFRREPQVGPIVFITDDSNAERNALKLCWPKGNP